MLPPIAVCMGNCDGFFWFLTMPPLSPLTVGMQSGRRSSATLRGRGTSWNAVSTSTTASTTTGCDMLVRFCFFLLFLFVA